MKRNYSDGKWQTKPGPEELISFSELHWSYLQGHYMHLCFRILESPSHRGVKYSLHLMWNTLSFDLLGFFYKQVFLLDSCSTTLQDQQSYHCPITKQTLWSHTIHGKVEAWGLQGTQKNLLYEITGELQLFRWLVGYKIFSLPFIMLCTFINLPKTLQVISMDVTAWTVLLSTGIALLWAGLRGSQARCSLLPGERT